jgi:hypothetical protein
MLAVLEKDLFSVMNRMMRCVYNHKKSVNNTLRFFLDMQVLIATKGASERCQHTAPEASKCTIMIEND